MGTFDLGIIWARSLWGWCYWTLRDASPILTSPGFTVGGYELGEKILDPVGIEPTTFRCNYTNRITVL